LPSDIENTGRIRYLCQRLGIIRIAPEIEANALFLNFMQFSIQKFLMLSVGSESNGLSQLGGDSHDVQEIRFRGTQDALGRSEPF